MTLFKAEELDKAYEAEPTNYDVVDTFLKAIQELRSLEELFFQLYAKFNHTTRTEAEGKWYCCREQLTKEILA